MHKKRNDWILIIVILIFSFGIWLSFNLSGQSKNLTAYVYYESKLTLTIDLSSLGEDIVVYKVIGANGEMIIEAKHNAIRVEKEDSPFHYCSNQGFSSNTKEPIICLPNKVYIKLVGDTSDVDIEI